MIFIFLLIFIINQHFNPDFDHGNIFFTFDGFEPTHTRQKDTVWGLSLDLCYPGETINVRNFWVFEHIFSLSFSLIHPPPHSLSARTTLHVVQVCVYMCTSVYICVCIYMYMYILLQQKLQSRFLSLSLHQPLSLILLPSHSLSTTLCGVNVCICVHLCISLSVYMCICVCVYMLQLRFFSLHDNLLIYDSIFHFWFIWLIHLFLR